jgi:general secretion pathway protein N
MKNTKRLVLAGIITFVVGLIITFPARVAYQWFAPAELKLNGINGSIWRGSATQGSAGGIYLSDINWSFRPLGLVTGKLAYAASSKLASGFIDANVAVGVGGSLVLSDVTGALTLDTLAEMLPLSGIQGDISLQFDELVVEDGLPVEVTGTLKIANLVSRYLSPTSLGDYQANFETEADVILGYVDAISGVLDLIGTIKLRNDRSYEFTGQVAAKPGAPINIAQQLQLLGSPDSEGRREFRIEGQL